MTALAGRIESSVRGRSLAVVGVGNRLRGDDAAGSLVAGRLTDASGGRVFDAETTPENYLGALLEYAPELVLFVDAADLGAAPGTCRMAPIAALAPRQDSTHAPSLRLLAELLGGHGIESLMLGIQPACTSPGAPLSPQVAGAVDEAAEALARVLGCEVSRD